MGVWRWFTEVWKGWISFTTWTSLKLYCDFGLIVSEICSHYALVCRCQQGCCSVLYICPYGFGAANTISICTLGNIAIWSQGHNIDTGLFQYYSVLLINHIYIFFPRFFGTSDILSDWSDSAFDFVLGLNILSYGWVTLSATRSLLWSQCLCGFPPTIQKWHFVFEMLFTTALFKSLEMNRLHLSQSVQSM